MISNRSYIKKIISSINSTGTFDVRNATVMNIKNGRVCLSKGV